MSLLVRASARHLRRHPWQLALSVAGVALGVAVMVAMDLAIQSSREAFRVSTETVTGRATHQLLAGPTGVGDSLVARVRLEPGVVAAAPVVEGWMSSPGLPGRPLRLLGVDPFAEAPFRAWLAGGPGGALDGTLLLTTAGGAFLGRETADALGVDEGDAFAVQGEGASGELRVVGVLDPDDRWSRMGLRDLVVVDVAEAQDRLGRPGRLDRVDLRVEGTGGLGADEAAAALRAILPPGVSLEPAGTREAVMADMIRAFDLNLTALSLLALVFGVFLIYNAVTFSVVQRRGLLGTFRALGVTRSRVVAGVLGEAAAVGAVGAALGVAAGIALGRGLVRLVTRTINDLYFVVSVEGLALPPEVLVRGGVVGVAATLLAALPPAREAGRAEPREAMGRSWAEEGARTGVVRAARWGLALMVLGVGLLLVPPPAGGEGVGGGSAMATGVGLAFAGLFAVILGMAALVPLATVALVGLLRPLARRVAGVVGAMAARSVVTSLSRTGPAMAALVVAVSVTVGLGIMIQSFRGSVERWLDVTLQADLYVSAPSTVAARPGGPLPPGLDDAVRGISGVAGVSTSRGVEVVRAGRILRLMAVDPAPQGDRGVDLMVAPEGPERTMADFRAGRGVLVSEPFATRHRAAPGDPVELDTDSGPVSVTILGVYRDYGSEMGTVMVPRVLYDAHWDDPRVNALGLYLEPGADPDAVAAAVRAAAGAEVPLVVRSNRELRARSLEVFDRTFQVTRVLRLLAFGVAFIAVLSALMALQLERTRELGVLRASGMTPGQVGGLVTAQTGIMGLIAGVLSLPVGWVLAMVMIHVVNRRSFGWTLEMTVAPGLLLHAVGLALAAALLAGVHPARRMAATSPAEALRGRHASLLALVVGGGLVGSLAGCGPDRPDPQLRATLSPAAALAGADTAGYARADGPRDFRFPEDHGAHPDYRIEWWYLTGHLTEVEEGEAWDGEWDEAWDEAWDGAWDEAWDEVGGEVRVEVETEARDGMGVEAGGQVAGGMDGGGAGRSFGYQLTFFRTAVAPEVPERISAWNTNQLWMAHLALTDVEGGRHHAAERLARGAAGLAGARAEPFRVWLDGWTLEGTPGGRQGLFPLELAAHEGTWGLRLSLDQAKPMVFQGDRGWSRKGPEPGNASYYYSFTRIATRGTVELGGVTFQVEGLSWMDREWSTSALDEIHQGWDWFSIQLDDGRDIMFFELRRADGGRDPMNHGVVVAPGGEARPLAEGDWSLEVLGTWPSPVDGAEYPSGWQVKIPGEGLELELAPRVADQEMNLSFRYWEGAVSVSGTGPDGPVRGRGFVELTGYADREAGGRSPGELAGGT